MKTKGLSLLLALFFCVFSVQAKDVLLGGESVGIELHYEGLLVISTYNVQANGKSYDPSTGDIQSGDTLTAVNGIQIESIEDLNNILEQNINQIVQCTIMRNDKTIYRDLNVLEENGKIKTGLFVKDEIMGIGTLTYIDPENNTFASLGHEVVDSDTKQVIRLDNGSLYTSEVISIQKAQISRVGEKEALIHFDRQLGSVNAINRYGIYGTSTQQLSERLIETAQQNEISLSDAIIYTVIEGNEVEPITIRITKKAVQETADVKSFEFVMTDEKALEKTGGIVQGMSGSPIVQNGKLIGAVTHVSSKDPKAGYGLYIEWMLKQSDLNRR